jgi:hypothetical protein
MPVNLLNDSDERVHILDVNGSRMIAQFGEIHGGTVIVDVVSDRTLSEDDRAAFEAWAKSGWTTPPVPFLHFEYGVGHR